MTGIFWAAGAFAFPPLFALAAYRPHRASQFYARWAYSGLSAAFTSGIVAATGGGWLYVAGFGASGLLGLILWWWSRRKRKRSLKALGAKARARLAVMVKNMPRPSPRLVPQRMPV